MRNPKLMEKLINMLGNTRAEELYDDTLARAGLSAVDTPEDKLRFGNALVGLGGVMEAIGRSIKVQALLLGARERAETTPTTAS